LGKSASVDDAFLPIRVRGVIQANLSRGKFEILENGSWKEYISELLYKLKEAG